MDKNILILGSGGREHALAWRLLKDEEVTNVFVLPGNPGMEETAGLSCVEGSISDYKNIEVLCDKHKISLIVVGPEAPLAEGIADYFNDKEVAILAPSKAAALLESSKAFSKDFMAEFSIPTAKFVNFDNYEEAVADLDSNDLWNEGVVVKASSLAAGKGVFVCTSREEAKEALFNIMKNDQFTVNSDTVVLEQILKGKELSAFALCDGTQFVNLGYACDHKRLLDNDEGPNTGGMGTYIPQNWPSKTVTEKIEKQVFQKVLDGMKKKGSLFKGILFAGLMIDGDDVNVIEFNVRFGDPETQVLMPTLKGNLTQNFIAAAKHDLNLAKDYPLTLSGKCALHVVKVSKGYPSLDGFPMLKNQVIHRDHNFLNSDDIQLFYAGVSKQGNDLVNSGGRVLGVTAVADDLKKARELAYENLNSAQFEGAFWRRDIGSK